MKATIDDLIQDIKDIRDGKAPLIPYQLHEGFAFLLSVRNCKAQGTVEFLEQYRDQRKGE